MKIGLGFARSKSIVRVALLAILTTTAWPPPETTNDFRIVDITGEKSLRRWHHDLGVEPGLNITSHHFDANDDGNLDNEAVFARTFAQRVPADFTGIVSLDWEGAMSSRLRASPGSTQFELGVENLRRLLMIAKRTRPRAQIGFYGLPRREYWRRNDSWRTSANALDSVFRLADWIGPSVYPLYEVDKQQTPEEHAAYIRENVELSLEIGARLDRPVFVWITHRYHPSNETHALRPVAIEQFVQHVEHIFEVEHDGRRVAGVIWWGGDRYFVRTGRIVTGGNPDVDLPRLHEDYLFELVDTARRVTRQRRRVTGANPGEQAPSRP